MQTFATIIVVPIGPGCQVRFIEDTLSSFVHHSRSSYRIVLADDSQKGTGRLVQKLFPDADVVTTGRSMGKLCGLYLTLSLAFRYVLKHYHFEALLRIDTDALVIGSEPEKQAIDLFRRDPLVGMAGQYPLDYEGRPWDISWPQGQLKKYMDSYKFIRRPLTHLALWPHYRRALKNGYKPGESVFGGACFFSEACLRRLQSKGLLPKPALKDMALEEDHLFSLLVKAVGMKLGNLSSNDGPMGCAWKGLPASPRDLLLSGKKITHSVRNWKELDETSIREFFRTARQRNPASALATVTL